MGYSLVLIREWMGHIGGWVLVNKKKAKYAREAKNKAENTT